MKPKILVIVGPTASGKSALAIKLAKKLGGEIVSADSRQIYKGLDIGSGKVTKRQMGGIPHHLLDVASPKQVFSVVQYQKLAYKATDEILKRGKLPIIAGGTGQYVDAITKGLIIPEVKPRGNLRKMLNQKTSAKLFLILKKLDPIRAKNIDRHNLRRLVRAIEIAKALGKVPALKSQPRYSPIIIGIRPPDNHLRRNISIRLLARIRTGMIAEVKRLHKQGLSWQRLYNLGLEYRYISLYLRGELSKYEMLSQLETAINQYAKRQWTWFKRDKSIWWLVPSQVERITRPALSLLLRIRFQLRANAAATL